MSRLAVLAVASLLLAGCAATPAADDGLVHVVASTNVYGSIAQAIGGDHVSVTSLIDGAAQDPHSFEASAQDQLALSKADIVIENGGGYDDFVDLLLDAASSDAVVVNAAEVVGLAAGANEHLWYDFSAVSDVARALSVQLARLDPVHGDQFVQNFEDFDGLLHDLMARMESLGEGKTVAITEPVPLYLLESAGFTNVTPAEFSEAIEEGADVAPTILRDTIDAVKSADLLAYNSQTASPETEQLRTTAEDAGVPVVEFTETMPDGDDYITWMLTNVTALS